MVSSEPSLLRIIGLALACFGITLSIIGLFLDHGTVVIGDIQLLCGLILIVGPVSFIKFLMNRENCKASLSLVVGFVFILAGWPKIGLFLEQYGLGVVLRGLWPSLFRKKPRQRHAL